MKKLIRENWLPIFSVSMMILMFGLFAAFVIDTTIVAKEASDKFRIEMAEQKLCIAERPDTETKEHAEARCELERLRKGE